MDTSDKQFFLTFLVVTGILGLIAVVVLFVASMLGGTITPEKSVAQIRIAKERIEPVGKVNLKSDPVQVVETDDPTAVVTAETGETQESATLVDKDPGQKVYSGICQSCHAIGVAAAPIVGDTEAWETRIAKGIDVLYANSINGIGIMPPKGGNPALSDEEVKKAVDYMIKASR